MIRKARYYSPQCNAFVNHARIQLDRFMRKVDFEINRLSFMGCSWMAFVLFEVNLKYLFCGPSLPERGLGVILLFMAASILMVALAPRIARKHWLYQFQAVILTASALIVGLAMPSEEACKAHLVSYRHVFVILIPALGLLAAIVAPWLSKRLTKQFQARYHGRWGSETLYPLLTCTELFVVPARPGRILIKDFVANAMRVIIQRLHDILLILSFIGIFAHEDYLTSWWAWGLGAVLTVMLGFGTSYYRFEDIWKRLSQCFFRGPQVVPSCIIIVLAAARFFDYQYVSTLLNSTSGYVIASYVIGLYAMSWLFDMWISAILCERLLTLLLPEFEHSEPTTSVDYPFQKQDGNTAYRTATLEAERKIEVHGRRFIVVGKYLADGQEKSCWETYGPATLFCELVQRANCTDPKGREHVSEQWGLYRLRSLIQFYYAFFIVILATVLIVASVAVYSIPRRPLLTLTHSECRETERIRHTAYAGLESAFSRLADKNNMSATSGNRNQIILLAASGGGSRAALYTASVLHGLWSQGVLRDVEVCSGVSGGSAALAYFSMYHDALSSNDATAWQDFFGAMSAPYIDDVIRASTELRFISTGLQFTEQEPLGRALAESFERHMTNHATDPKTTLGGSPVGLIFNTTLAGTSEWNAAQSCWWPPKAIGAGGRLVLTNLQASAIFPKLPFDEKSERQNRSVSSTEVKTASPGDIGMKFVVLRDPAVRLTDAAAASANFPPVFSNVSIERPGHARYWVTDGGAADNRGLISLLYMLRSTLDNLSADTKSKVKHWPTIHIVVAEASAANVDYGEDRGVGSKFGSTEQYASQLAHELIGDIRQSYAKLGGRPEDIQLHYLVMPAMFRSRGGVGTHWMVPSRVVLSDPGEPNRRNAKSLVVSGALVRRLIVKLHCPDDGVSTQAMPSKHDFPDIAQYLEWLNGDPHKEVWDNLVRQLSPAKPSAKPK